jgi:hypothetical protein
MIEASSTRWVPVPAGLRHVVTRFPIPATCALGATALAVATGTHVPFAVSDEVSRALCLLLLALFAAVAGRLWAERTGATPVKQLALVGALVAALAARVYTLPIENSLGALMLAPGIVMLASTLPFAGRGDGDAFWAFNQGAWIGALIAFVIALALGLGLTLAFGTMDTLLGTDVPNELYGHVWTICLTLVWPLVAFALAPPIAATAGHDPGRLVTLLVTWVLVPVVAVYLVILYLYIARIAATAVLPSGEIAPMVGGCAAIAAIAHYLAFPLRATGASWVRFYHRHLFRLLLAPVLVLAYAVWVRIAAYGFTEMRYTLALLAVWLLVLTGHGVLWPAQRLALFPAILCGALLLGSFGPWGAIAVSERSQVGILHDLLGQSGILVEGRVAPAATEPDRVTAQRIGSVIAYLYDTGKRDAVLPWFATPPATWNDALAAMGVRYIAEWEDPGSISFWARADEATAVRGFDYWSSLSLYEGGTQTLTVGGTTIALTLRQSVLEAKAGAATVTHDLVPLALAARDAMQPDGAARPLTLDVDAGATRLRLVVQNLYAQQVGERFVVNSLSGALLVGANDD